MKPNSDCLLGKTLADVKPPQGLVEAQAAMKKAIKDSAPFFAGRFGSVELKACLRMSLLEDSTVWQKSSAFFLRGWPPFFVPGSFWKLSTEAGFFPARRDFLYRFLGVMRASMTELDLLGSWVPGEAHFDRALTNAVPTALESFEPFFVENPWTAALANKKVLVIHPFSDTIHSQYESSRELLFPRDDILPEFDLDTLKAVQTLGRGDKPFTDWFSALDWMAQEALTRQFDVAIVGCGAYGFPLSARLKAAGKTVIHLGGMTQILFGIRGRRWDLITRYQNLFNDNWSRPSAAETPTGHARLGRGSYW